MRIVAITGTNVKGCTHAMMDLFLDTLRAGNTVESFTLPNDGPPYCIGCKNCFLQGEEHCPHAAQVMPIWNAMLGADLIVLAYPVYALRAPAQVKALLDHLCAHWIVHRPKPDMFPQARRGYRAGDRHVLPCRTPGCRHQPFLASAYPISVLAAPG